MARRGEAIRLKWLGVYRAYEGSGLTVRDFCRERGVNYYTFKGWQQRFGKEEGGGFRELVPVAGDEASYSVVLRNGRELRLGAGFSAARVRQLVELLESC
jgi:hypothetical protein